ncbi:MAG: 50S ribosomal protein L1 [Anaerolineae bacterium]
MGKHGKRYLDLREKVDRTRDYEPREAMDLVRSFNSAKFDETVELHLRMNVDPRRADQALRGIISLPEGTGKKVTILVFAEGEEANAARQAGADYVGTDEFIEKIQDGWTEFDIAVAVPQVMGKIGRLGRILGPRGLMPSPKSGTLVQPDNIAETIQQLRQGRVEYRIDRSANLHIPIGKATFDTDQLMNNLLAVADTIWRARPATVKGQYVRRATLCTTMSPGVRVNVRSLADMRTS